VHVRSSGHAQECIAKCRDERRRVYDICRGGEAKVRHPSRVEGEAGFERVVGELEHGRDDFVHVDLESKSWLVRELNVVRRSLQYVKKNFFCYSYFILKIESVQYVAKVVENAKDIDARQVFVGQIGGGAHGVYGQVPRHVLVGKGSV